MKKIRLITWLFVVLFTFDAYAQTEEMSKAKAQIAELLKIKVTILQTTDLNPHEKQTWAFWGTEKNVSVFEDRIEFGLKKTISTFYFADFADFNIRITTDQQNNVGVLFENFYIPFTGNVNGKLLVDNLNTIRNYYSEKLYNSELALFEPIAAFYLSLKIKPPVSESQRERIVQANLFNQQRQYTKAIEFYLKAIEVDPTSYPAAYSNLALLSAQISRFDAAVYYMKKYLMLEPEAEDARGAQDKIYEWKAQMVK